MDPSDGSWRFFLPMKWMEIVLDESTYRCGVLMTALVVAPGGVCLSAQIEGRKVSGVVVAAATDRPVSDAQVKLEARASGTCGFRRADRAPPTGRAASWRRPGRRP